MFELLNLEFNPNIDGRFGGLEARPDDSDPQNINGVGMN